MADNKIWADLETEYIAGNESVAELAKKYGVSGQAARSRCQRGKWGEKREAFRRESGAKALERAEAQAARAHAKSLEKLVESSMLQEELIYEIFRDARDGKAHLSPGKMLQLSLALDTATKTRRNLMGLPTQAEKESQKIARARLKLDKQKAEAGEAGAGDGVTVVIKVPEGMDAEEISG